MGKRPGRRLFWGLAFAVLCAPAVPAVFVAPAEAETLRDALATAYTANPQLEAERARQRATDEGVPQALSGSRPTVRAGAEVGYERTFTRRLLTPGPGVSRTTSDNNPRGVSIEFSQPIFRGFRTITGTAAAEEEVLSGRYLLNNVEQNVLLDAVTAYVDVVRDTALVRLTQGNLQVLVEELDSTNARFEVGELTKTDVAQAEARVSGARSDVSQARANLSRSRAVYERVIRRPPGGLAPPTSLNGILPHSLAEAYQIGEAEHPALLSTRHSVAASDHTVENIKGELLPSISLDGDYRRNWDTGGGVLDSESMSIVGRLSIPLYQAGSVSSRVRQARQRSTERRMVAEDLRAEVRSAIATSWDGLTAARDKIVADRQQIEATTVALDGVRQEQRVGHSAPRLTFWTPSRSFSTPRSIWPPPPAMRWLRPSRFSHRLDG